MHQPPGPGGAILRLSGRGASDEGAELPAGASTPAPLLAAHLCVMIVDDVEDTRELYERYFHFRGLRALSAGDGPGALRLAAAQCPDVIVLDLAMPGMTGWDVIRALRTEPATEAIPIVVLSGQNARESALQAGADSYLEKPSLPDELLAEILRVVAAARARRGH